ncbi:MAG TPA: META domain-containing protein [Thermoleophilia bacterium]|nr:META domain-containing protein [Thermoleophilia bacterium]
MGARLSGVIVAAVLLAVVLGTAGCWSAGGDTHALDGTSWRLTGWTLSSLDPHDFTITAKFADGRISGSSGVNAYGGPYSAGPGAAFSVGDLAVTAMGGSGPAMRAEQTFLTLLGAVRSFEESGSRLTLFDEHGNASLVFRAAGAG